MTTAHYNQQPYLTSKTSENNKLPLYVRPIYNEEKIREILHIQDPRDDLYKTQRFHEKNQEQMEYFQKFAKLPQEQQQQQQQKLQEQDQMTCYWRDIIKLEGVPINSVQAFWNPEKRCVIVTAKYANMEDETGKNMPMDNDSELNSKIRWDEEKNLYRFKQVLPVPKFVCAKDLECYIDTERKVFILCARRSNKFQQYKDQKDQKDQKEQGEELEKDCTVQGREYDLHQRCQPFKALLKVNKTTTTDEDFQTRRGNKYLTETPETYYASKRLREQMKEIKRTSFPGLMQSPRFVKDEKTNQYVLRLQFRLRQAIFRPEDVQVRTEEKRRAVIIEAKREVRENNMLQVVHILREFTLPEVVDLSKLKYRFLSEEGVLRMDIPLIKEKFLANPKQQ
jgi:hypothetical protein